MGELYGVEQRWTVKTCDITIFLYWGVGKGV